MKVLITGVGGLLGSRLADWIIRNNCDVQVIGIDDFSCGYRENVPGDVLLFHDTLGTGGELLDSLCKNFRPEIVYHFAAYAAEGLSPFIRNYNYRNNLLATAEV